MMARIAMIIWLQCLLCCNSRPTLIIDQAAASGSEAEPPLAGPCEIRSNQVKCNMQILICSIMDEPIQIQIQCCRFAWSDKRTNQQENSVSLSFIHRISTSVTKTTFKNLLCIESNLWSPANQIRKAERSNKRKIMPLSGILYQQHQPLTYCSALPHKHSSGAIWNLLFGGE